jgi:hypothetical protein
MVQWTDKPAAKPQAPQAAAAQPAPDAAMAAAPRVSARRPVRRGGSSGLQSMVVMGLAVGLAVASWFLFAQMSSHATPPSVQTARGGQSNPVDAGIGRIVVSDRGDCREMGFDNYSGQTIAKGKVDCDSALSVDPTESLNRYRTKRIDAVRRSFQGPQ